MEENKQINQSIDDDDYQRHPRVSEETREIETVIEENDENEVHSSEDDQKSHDSEHCSVEARDQVADQSLQKILKNGSQTTQLNQPLLGGKCPLPGQEVPAEISQAAKKIQNARRQVSEPQLVTTAASKPSKKRNHSNANKNNMAAIGFVNPSYSGKKVGYDSATSGEENHSIFSQMQSHHSRQGSNYSKGSYRSGMSQGGASLDSGNVTVNIGKYDRLPAEHGMIKRIVEVRIDDDHVEKRIKNEKMDSVQTFFAVCKCYCAINVLVTPKSFQNGGYLFTPISLIFAGALQCLCAIKLTECGMHLKKISYPDIVYKALDSRKAKKFLEICLSIVHFQFTIAQLSFIIEGLKSTTESLFDIQDLKPEYFGLIVLCFFSPIAWIRKIETFKIGFMFGFAMIIVTLLTVSAFCVSMNMQPSNPKQPLQTWEERGFVPINYEGMYSAIGFQFFIYEGIGGVMPIMSATANREQFPFILTLAIIVLTFMHIFFSELCYYTFGKDLNVPIIIDKMPADNPIIQVVKLLFILNLVFSYPLTIFITNVILESFTFRSFKKSTFVRKWLKNAQRSLILLLGIICAIYLKDSLDKILALSGTLMGTTCVMKFPVICHYKLLAKTKCQKAVDIIILMISFTVTIVVSYKIIQSW